MRHMAPLLLVSSLPIWTPERAPSPQPPAAPRIIMFYGAVLEERRYMTDFAENMQFMGAIHAPALDQREALGRRRFIEVAMYWHNPTWERYAADAVLLKTLRPEAGQPARLYLSNGEGPPLFDYYSAGGLRSISREGLEILERHRVPTTSR